MATKPGDAPFNAYIVQAVRTPGGKRGGRLSGWHPADLGALVVDALLERAGVDGANVDDVAWGCVTQSGAQAENAGRNVVLSSKRLPNTVPAYTMDRQCGSAQQAIHSAAQAVMSGTQDCVIAGGVEMMSVVPMDSNVDSTWEGGPHTGEGIAAMYGQRTRAEYAQFGADPHKFDQFVGAELVAKKYGITRQDSDAFAVRSHTLAAAATKAGRFPEIVPVRCKTREGISKVHPGPDEDATADEGIRPDSTLEGLGKLKPLLKGGTLTAAAASQICDGAAAVLICNERALERFRLTPRARIVALALAGTDPIVMLEGPVPATKAALEKANLTVQDLDLIEVNEAFASVPLAWARAMTGGDISRLNVNGGAIARGHPMGATGAMLMSNLVSELERRGGRYGLLTMCESGGTANATIIERTNVVRAAQVSGPASPGTKGVSTQQTMMTMGRALGVVAGWKDSLPAITVAGPSSDVPVKTITFKELEARSNRLARAYAFFKVVRNDWVTIMLPTGHEFVESCFACWKLGATPNNVGAHLTFREREEIVLLAKPRLIVGVPSLKDPNMKPHTGFRCLAEGFEPGPHLSTAPLPDTFANCWVVATSGGSTGRPKLIALAEPSFVTMQEDLTTGQQAMPDGFSILGGGKINGVDLVPAPLSHNAPFHCVVQGVLSASHQVILTRFHAERSLELIQSYRCTFSYMVPTMMKRIWDLPVEVRSAYDVSSLEGIFHMAAPCPPWLKEAWCAWLGPEKIWEMYGPTEAMAWTLVRGDEWRATPKVDGLNCVGRPQCGQMKIVDPETGLEVPPGTMGEIWMRHHEGRHTYLYFGAESRRDAEGWETVGDMGMMDQDGCLHLGDRRNDMVLVGGTNVYPAEIEAALEEHPAVKSCVVVGLPDADLGQVLHGVVYTGDASVTADELRLFLAERLEKKKVPRGFTWAKDHLRGEDGKVRRSHVAAWVLSLYGGGDNKSLVPASKL